jgi:ribosomal protein S14
MKHKRYVKNVKQRELYKKTEVVQKVLKSLFLYAENTVVKLVIQKKFLFNFSKKTFKTRIKNFCVISGRARGIYRKFQVSRIHFKLLGEKGLFFGLKKSS